MSETMIDRAAEALVALAEERPWRFVALRDVAEKIETPLADLYALAPGKVQLLEHLSTLYDRSALATAANPSDDPHDRLFDAVMARIEVMEPHREALIGIVRDAGLPALARHFPRTARALLEAAGIEATPPRLAAMTLVWARICQVWRDDQGALNRTMAEVDKRLKQMREQLGRLRAGF